METCRLCGKGGTNTHKDDFFHEYPDGEGFWHIGCHGEYTIFVGLMRHYKNYPEYRHPDFGVLPQTTTFEEYWKLKQEAEFK